MSNVLFHAHSGLRYLVLLLGVIAAVWGLVLAARGQGPGRVGRILGASFVGVLDLQIVLGIVLLLLRGFYPALFGHIMTMVVAAVLGHAAVIAARQHPETRRGALWLGGGALATLALVTLGITAIGRPVL
jgi:hypothetical protein